MASARPSACLLLLLLAFLTAASAASAPATEKAASTPASSVKSRKAQLGGWSPIRDVADPTVQDVAKFAVSEHNKGVGSSLGLVAVLSGETQVVAGTNYRLLIKASDGHVYQAVVWDQPWKNVRKLTSFTLKK